MDINHWVGIIIFVLMIVLSFYGLYWIVKKSIIISTKLNELQEKVINCNNLKDMKKYHSELQELHNECFHHTQYSRINEINAIILSRKRWDN